MFGDDNENKNLIFVNISNGKFTIKAKSPNEEKFGVKPTAREYTDKQGNTKTVYEWTTNNLNGIISRVKIRDTNFGDVIAFNLDNGSYLFAISAGTNSNYGRSIMEKLPNLTKGHRVELRAYDDFETDEGRKVYAGVSIKDLETEEKLKNYFFDKEAKSVLYGYPEVEDFQQDKDDWNIHWLKVEKFLKKFTKENVEPLYNTQDVQDAQDEPEQPYTENNEVDDGDVPF